MTHEIDNETDYEYYQERQRSKFLQRQALYYDDNYEPEPTEDEKNEYFKKSR
jgi:hypothetical protein